jgi:hypothetical protein
LNNVKQQSTNQSINQLFFQQFNPALAKFEIKLSLCGNTIFAWKHFGETDLYKHDACF